MAFNPFSNLRNLFLRYSRISSILLFIKNKNRESIYFNNTTIFCYIAKVNNKIRDNNNDIKMFL